MVDRGGWIWRKIRENLPQVRAVKGEKLNFFEKREQSERFHDVELD